MAEKLVNSVATTLNNPIASTSATLCSVVSATGFPTTGNFRIRIDNEILLVTGVNGTDFTILRGQEGTVATTHSSGAAVVHVLTRGALEARTADRFISDLYANKPAAGVKGRLFLPTDGYFLEYDDGAAWYKYGPYVRLKPPPVTGWSWVNQGNATAVHTGSALILEDPDLDATNPQLRLYVRPMVGSTLTTAFAINGVTTSNGQGGMCYREVGGSYDGRIAAAVISLSSSDSYIYRQDYTSATATNGSGSVSVGIFPSRLIWMRYNISSVDGYTRQLSYSADGVNFKYFASANSASIYPSQYGLFIDPVNNVQKLSLSCVHWEEV